MSLLIPFALRLSDNRVVDPSAVDKGRNCGCVCPACKKPLVARKGQKNTAHFAHLDLATCPHAYETSIHQAAKQIIKELGYVWLPESIVSQKIKFEFASLEIEEAIDGLRPDALARATKGPQFGIEIYVTHEVDMQKRQLLRAQRLSSVEYDLSTLPRDTSYETLRELFVEGSFRATWIYNRKAEIAELEKQRLAQQEELRRKAEDAKDRINLRPQAKLVGVVTRKTRFGRLVYHVDPCPLAKAALKESTFASVELVCSNCKYYFGKTPTRAKPITHIKCAGHCAPEVKARLERWGLQLQFVESKSPAAPIPLFRFSRQQRLGLD